MSALLSSLTPERCLRRYPDFKFKLTSLWLKQFKKLLGYSPDQVEDDLFVPDSVFTCFRTGDFEVFKILEIDLDQLLHTTQSYEFLQKISVGADIQTHTEVTKVRSKLNSETPFVALEISTTHFCSGVVAARSWGSLFVREPIQ